MSHLSLTDYLLYFSSNYLIEFMGFVLVVALTLRFLAYRSSRFNQVYFNNFTRQVELNIEKDKDKHVQINDVEEYMTDILGRVSAGLPERSVRFGAPAKMKRNQTPERVTSLREYVGGKKGLIQNILMESSVFKVKHPPRFDDLTERIMSHDRKWTNLFNLISIDGVMRLMDILPGLFIVFGIFGTFVGISMALPEISKIDFTNFEASGKILADFVINITFAMKTSVAGIFYSLMLTFLNTFFPIKNLRYSIFKKMESCLEYLWYTIQGDDHKSKDVESILPEIQEALLKLNTTLSEMNSGKKLKKEA